MNNKTRVLKETKFLIEDPPPGISGGPLPNNYRYFNILIEGPQGSP